MFRAARFVSVAVPRCHLSLRREAVRLPSFLTSINRLQPSLQSDLVSFSTSESAATVTTAEIERLLDAEISPEKAHSLFNVAIQTLDPNTFTPESIRGLRKDLFISWINYHRESLEKYKETIQNSTDDIAKQKESLGFLETSNQAVEAAHNILDDMEPLLGARDTLDDPRRTTVTNSYLVDASGASSELLSHCTEVLHAWAKTIRAAHDGEAPDRLRSSPQQAQYLLRGMQAYSETHGLAHPSIENYNFVLESISYSTDPLRTKNLVKLFDKLLSMDQESTTSLVRPTGLSYRLAILGLALSGEKQGVYMATTYMMKMLDELKESHEQNTSCGVDMEPTLEDMHFVLEAWVHLDKKTSPGKAQYLVMLLESSYKDGFTKIRPDASCYRSVLQCAAVRPYLPKLGVLVDDTLTTMRENSMVPDTECFTAAIRTWKNAAINQSANKEKCIQRAMALLDEMEVAHNQSSTVSVKVSTENVNDVLDSLTMSEMPRRFDKADGLLRRLESGGTHNILRPTVESYVKVLRVWKSAISKEKVDRAKDILLRFKDHLPTMNCRFEKGDLPVYVFNEFIRVCGSYKAKNEKEAVQVLSDAMSAIQLIKTLDSVEHTSTTYVALLEACSSLLPSGNQRLPFVEKIFTICCSSGMVDSFVLKQFRESASPTMFEDFVVAASVDVEGTQVVPESWTSNTIGKIISANAKGDHKKFFLSLDGYIKATIPVHDSKMRRLRSRINQKLLRGGRLETWKQTQRERLAPFRLYDSFS